MRGDGDLVFCHPERGTKISDKWFADELRAALKTAENRLRPAVP